MTWYEGLGLDPEKLRLRPHGDDELSHYSSATSDIEYLYPIGWSELEGIANRGDFDLTQHAKFSGDKLEYVDTATGERYVPHVIEPAGGVGRAVLALMCDAYREEEIEGRQRVVLGLHPKVAPVKVAVLPLVNRDGMPELARRLYEELRTRMPAEYDAGGSIGKRYRRQDEIGTPWGVTVDGQTVEDDTVTLRDRDSLEQVRLPLGELGDELARPARHRLMRPDGAVFRRTRPRGPLAEFVDSIWVYEGEGGDHELERRLPTPELELYLSLSGPSADLVGPATGPVILGTAEQRSVLGVEFRIGAAPALLGVPAAELRDQRVPPAGFLGSDADALLDRVLAASGVGGKAAGG